MRDNLDHPLVVAALGAASLVLPRSDRHAPKPVPLKRRRHAIAQTESTQAPGKRGWWAILKAVGREISDNQLMTQAAAITFYALLSIFPALAAMVSIYGLIADPSTITHQVDALSGVLPGGGQDLLSSELKALTQAGSGGLGWGLAIGVATSLWTANQAMKAIFNALNAVHDVREKRSFIKLTLMTLACTAGVILFMVVALAAVVVVPAALGLTGGDSFVATLIAWLRWPLLLVVVALVLAVLYRFGPCRDKVVWRWVTRGSAFAAVMWLVVSGLFSWYVANFGSYNKTYGSLGAVVGFMTWLWISSTVVLIGAQLDAELERATVGRQRTRADGDQPVRQTDGPAPV